MWLTGRFAPDTQEGFENVLVLDNVPIVDEGKRDKLVARLRSEFNKAGAPIDEENISMPWDDQAGTNKGSVASGVLTVRQLTADSSS
jgi:translation initiation factor 3 subunit B